MISGASSSCSRLLGVADDVGRLNRHSPPISAVDLGHVLDVGLVVGVVAGLGGEPAVEDLAQHGLRGRAQAEREHVRVVPRPRAARGLGVAAQRGPHAAHLVGGDRGAGPGPAADDSLLGAALGDVAGGPLAGPRPVAALAARQRAVRDRLVAAPAQLVHQRRAPGACPCRSRPRPSSGRRISAARFCYPSAPVSPERPADEQTARSAEPPSARTPTRMSDIRYYRESRSREAPDRPGRRAGARGPQREALVLLPLVAGCCCSGISARTCSEPTSRSGSPRRSCSRLVGWRFARDLGRALGPRLLARFDDGTASTVSFLVQLMTLRRGRDRGSAAGGPRPARDRARRRGHRRRARAGGAEHARQPDRRRHAPDRRGRSRSASGFACRAARWAASSRARSLSVGLIYTTLGRGEERILVPNIGVISASIVPLRRPAGVDLRARLPHGVKPSDLQRLLDERGPDADP